MEDQEESLNKVKAETFETKLQQIRAKRGHRDTERTCKHEEELDQVQTLVLLKQKELVAAAETVQRLSDQLEALRSRPILRLARLQRELQIQTRVNSERGSHPDLTERRLNQLRQRLWTKKNLQRHKENLPVSPSVPGSDPVCTHRPGSVPTTGSVGTEPSPDPGVLLQVLYQAPHLVPGSRVAAVGPYSSLTPPPRPAKPSTVSEVPPPVPSRSNQRHSHLNAEAPPPVPLQTNHITEVPLRNKQSGSKMAAVPPPLPKKSHEPSSFRSATLPLPKHRPAPAAAIRPLTPDRPDPAQATPTALHRPITVTASSIYSLYTSGSSAGNGTQGRKYIYGYGTLPRTRPTAYSKPVGLCGGPDAELGCRSNSGAVSMVTDEDARRPLSPTKLLPPLLRLLNAPRPLKKRCSISEPDGAPQLLRLRYQRTTLAAMETRETSGAVQTRETLGAVQTRETSGAVQTRETSGAVQTRETMESSHEDMVQEDFKTEILTPPPLPPRIPITDPAHWHLQAPPSPTDEKTTLEQNQDQDQDFLQKTGQNQKETCLQSPLDSLSSQPLKSILRSPGSDRGLGGLRVRFNPVSLLLDSALEGEYHLVQRVIYEVEDPSSANDEGITALHNAVCAGHAHITRFLLDFGVNVNAADSDGWTPLHCAASCNNTDLCKVLVESGAAVLAWTRSDSLTAADKCEEQDEGYAQCSRFLYGVQEKMGVMNRGQVFALWDFEPERQDELRLRDGDCLTVLDQLSEGLWWWVRGAQGEGYVPRNLLGLYPRIKPRQRSLA